MQLSVHADMAPVHRTLEALALQLGAVPDDSAPTRLHYQTGILTLTHQGQMQIIPMPIHPKALGQMLQQLLQPPAQHLGGGWQFDATARQLQRDGVNHALTEKESLLLATLLAALPDACTREQLLRDVWGIAASDIETHTLETHIYRLRHKLAELTPKPCDIVTAGSAYHLEMDIA